MEGYAYQQIKTNHNKTESVNQEPGLQSKIHVETHVV